ncbi:MAG: HAMP domain-containing histidine kinase, partial [Niabella sp.]|nr:HAMP domain-containing histidine kinase [Niabella sp.]
RIVCSLFVYTLSGCYFHTGAEYFLMNTLVLTIIVFDNRWTIAIISSLMIAATVLSLTFPVPVQIGPAVGVGRIWTNIALSMLFTVLALYFFKSIQQDYQQEIEKQKQALFLMNQDKERLFSIIAHDIRSPLSGLEALIEQFQEGMLTGPELSEASVIIRNRVSALNMTLDNLLRWSALGMQGIKTQTQHFLLIPVIEEVLQFFTIVAAQKDIHIAMEVDEEVAVYADPNQIAVILRNLISNALKFSHAGGTVTISAGRKEPQVLLCVADEGVGMDEQRTKTLFAGLQQPGFGTSGERGTGLGLLLCKEFALQNKGTIHAESEAGKGTVFTLKLQKGRFIKESAAIG